MLRANSGKTRLQCALVETPGEAIKRERLARGLSREAVAAGAGVNASTVSRIERGVSKDPNKLGAIQAYLGIGPYADRTAASGALPDLTSLTNEKLVKHVIRAVVELAHRLPDSEASGDPFMDSDAAAMPRPNLRENLGRYTPEAGRREG